MSEVGESSRNPLLGRINSIGNSLDELMITQELDENTELSPEIRSEDLPNMNQMRCRCVNSLSEMCEVYISI